MANMQTNLKKKKKVNVKCEYRVCAVHNSTTSVDSGAELLAPSTSTSIAEQYNIICKNRRSPCRMGLLAGDTWAPNDDYRRRVRVDTRIE
jgi:hypothetical protein